MEEMRRIVSITLAALLLTLCIADTCLWIRGYTTGDTILYSWSRKPSGFHFIQLWTSRGGLRLMHGEQFAPQSVPQLVSWNAGLQTGTYSGPNYPTNTSGEGKGWQILGFEFWRLDSSYPHLDRHFKSITFPHALLIILLALYPFARAWKFIRTYRNRPTLRFAICPQCGYDTRFCRDKCPECGTAIAP